MLFVVGCSLCVVVRLSLVGGFWFYAFWLFVGCWLLADGFLLMIDCDCLCCSLRVVGCVLLVVY